MVLNQMLDNKIKLESEVCMLREINGKLQLEIGNLKRNKDGLVFSSNP